MGAARSGSLRANSPRGGIDRTRRLQDGPRKLGERPRRALGTPIPALIRARPTRAGLTNQPTP
eukprot:1351318-Lingulodinium_polyedra.AAC.1